jgi:hypothetical protein
MRQKGVDGGIVIAGSEGKSREGYFSSVVSGNELWVLHDGGDSYRVPNHLMNTIIALDLTKGKPVKLLHLDKPVSGFTLDDKNNAHYGISSNLEYHIIQFDL